MPARYGYIYMYMEYIISSYMHTAYYLFIDVYIIYIYIYIKSNIYMMSDVIVSLQEEKNRHGFQSFIDF